LPEPTWPGKLTLDRSKLASEMAYGGWISFRFHQSADGRGIRATLTDSRLAPDLKPERRNYRGEGPDEDGGKLADVPQPSRSLTALAHTVREEAARQASAGPTSGPGGSGPARRGEHRATNGGNIALR
jgi:hypothetical protein